MNSLAKAMGYLLAAVMLAAFALPASASSKLISLAVTPADLGPGPTVEVSAKITNIGTSNANSFQIEWKLPEGNLFKVVSASVGSSAGVFVNGLTPGYQGAVFTNQPPLGRNRFVTIKLMVEVKTGCTPASIDWFAYAWTGSPSSPSQSFTLANGQYRTSSTPACSIRFGTQPSDAFNGKTITGTALASESGDLVTVELLRNGSLATGATGQVAVSANSGCATANATNIDDGVATLASLLAVTVNPACVLTATAPGYGSVNSNQFKVLLPSGDLACGNEDTDNGASLRRLDNAIGNNDVGGGCIEIPYSLDFDGQTVTFLADYSVLPSSNGVLVEPAFAFELPWRSEYVSVPAPHQPIPYVQNQNPPVPLAGYTFAQFAQAVPLSTHQFDPADERFLLDFCPGQPLYETDVVTGLDVFTGLTLPGDFDTTDGGDNDLSALAGFQYGCVIERKVEVVPDGALCPTGPLTGANAICVKVTETGYLRGDWTATRTLR